jgi:hypothetical protein
MPTYLQTHPVPWLAPYVQRGYLTVDDAERLQHFAEVFGCRLDTVETEVVYYQAISGDLDLAIQGFTWLTRSCACLANRLEDGTSAGRCRARIVAQAAKSVNRRVMMYLPAMLDKPADRALLESVIEERGWQTRVA